MSNGPDTRSHCPECGHAVRDQTHSPFCWTVHQACAVGRIRTLEKIVADFHFMARRYAAGRSTWVPTTFNEHTQVLLDMGVHLDDADGVVFAHHGLGRGYDPLTEEEAAQSARKALSWFEKEPEIVAARAEVERLRAVLEKIAAIGEVGPDAAQFTDDVSGWDNSDDIHDHGVECGMNSMAEIARAALDGAAGTIAGQKESE